MTEKHTKCSHLLKKCFSYMILSLLISNCTFQDKPHVAYNVPSTSGEKIIETTDPEVGILQKKIHIQFIKGVSPREYETKLREALSFLLSEFGSPLYNGATNIIITDNPNDNGKMAWSDAKRKQRSIILHKSVLLPTQLYVLAHELFHSLYQTNNFIKSNPDFITEGLAIYAEYKYRYKHLNNSQILNILSEECFALDPDYMDKTIDFDKPFSFYSSVKMELMYRLAGMLFFSQNSKIVNKKIRSLLVKGQRYTRQPFAQLVTVYGLDISHPIFAQRISNSITLPAPLAIATNKKYIQIMTSKREEAINHMKNKLQELNFKVFMDFSNNLHILSVGPFNDYKTAEKVKIKLRKYKFVPKDIFIKNYNSF